MSKHTPPPWRVWHRDAQAGGPLITDRDGVFGIARAMCRLDTADKKDVPLAREANANADFIVRAVNCHDELLAACREALDRECYDADRDEAISLKDACYCTDTGAGDGEGHGDILECLPCKLSRVIAKAEAL